MQMPALIIIDVLNDFMGSWPPESRRRLTDSINDLTGIMREFGRPVLWIRQEFEPDLSDAFPEMRVKGIRKTIKGTPGCEIVPELAVADGEQVIWQERSLSEILRRQVLPTHRKPFSTSPMQP